MYYWCFHYFKRIMETFFVSRNCAYYWTFGAYVAYYVNHPLYTPVTDLQMKIGFGFGLINQFSNFNCHLLLRSLRSPDGKGGYQIPRGFLFNIVTCANYTTEIYQWLGFNIATQTVAGYVFLAVAASIMTNWALGKHRRLVKKFGLYVPGVSERTESDGAANLIQKLRAINYALSELGQWCAYQVAESFLTALQKDERANYQLDVKFQESYLNKVVSLLHCQLSEGAVFDKDVNEIKVESDIVHSGGAVDELEEGELPDSHGRTFALYSLINRHVKVSLLPNSQVVDEAPKTEIIA